MFVPGVVSSWHAGPKAGASTIGVPGTTVGMRLSARSGGKQFRHFEVRAARKILPLHRAQVLTYLKLTQLRLGLLINFNVEVLRSGVYRVINGSPSFVSFVPLWRSRGACGRAQARSGCDPTNFLAQSGSLRASRCPSGPQAGAASQ